MGWALAIVSVIAAGAAATAVVLAIRIAGYREALAKARSVVRDARENLEAAEREAEERSEAHGAQLGIARDELATCEANLARVSAKVPGETRRQLRGLLAKWSGKGKDEG